MVTIRLRDRARPPLRRRARRVLSAIVKLRGGKPMEEVFDASHLQRMLRSGQAEDAHYYLQRFLLRIPVKDRSPLSDQLLHQVGLFKILATVARGGEDGAVLASMFKDLNEEDTLQSPACARLHKMIARMHAQPRWASKVWQQVEPGQVTQIMESVSRCPDLQGEVRLPRKRILLSDPTTRWLCKYRSRCRKTTNHMPSDAIVREFLQKRLLTTQGRNDQEFLSSASSSVSLNMKSELIAQKPINLAAPMADATVVAGMLGGDGSLGHKVEADASKSNAGY